MNFGSFQFHMLSDGFFTLDPGAYYGIVPKPVWSKYSLENEAGRVKLALNVPLLVGKDFSILLDSGIGSPENPKLASIFQVDKSSDLLGQIRNIVEPGEIRFILQSHLHFDHSGHSLDGFPGEPVFPNAWIVAQKSEFQSYWRPNEFTRSSYWRNDLAMRRAQKIRLNGSSRVAGEIRTVHTGGHTAGHQVIIVGSPGNEIIYFGDLIPSAFHVRIPYVTAIDSFPIETVRMKKKLVSKAIKDRAVCIFNHDSDTPAGTISGDVEKPKVEKIWLD